MVRIYTLMDAVGTLEMGSAMIIAISGFVVYHNYKQDRHMKTKCKQRIVQRIKQMRNKERKFEEFDYNE